MANKEQCRLCKGYNPDTGLCTVKWSQMAFDGTDCVQFKEAGSKPPAQEMDTPPKTEGTRARVGKRGKSFDRRNVLIEGQRASVDEEELPSKKKELVIEIPSTALHVAGWAFLVLMLCCIGYGIYAYMDSCREEKPENLVWEARRQMQFINTDGQISYLRLNDVDYKDHELQLTYTTRIHHADSISPDSVIYPEFRSVVALEPSNWDSVFSYLAKADVALRITYSNALNHPSLRILSNELHTKLLTKDMQAKGLEFFVNRKVAEVMNDARSHFRHDFFTVDSLTIDDRYVALHLSYDDSKARLGASYLDTTAVNLHFRDVVGETGTLLDGIWAISSRFQLGFAFVYTGKKNHKVDCVAWDVDRARDVYQKNRVAVKGRNRRNNIRTVITQQ